MVLHSPFPRRFTFLVAGAALAATASVVSAQGRPLFEWRGRVDHEVWITMRGREAWLRAGGPNEYLRARPVVSRPLPQQEGLVRVHRDIGRGDVDVVQQPTRRNSYTAIVRIRDRSDGAASYAISASWFDASYGSGRGRSGRGRGDPGGWGDEDDGWGTGRDRNQREVLWWRGQVDDRLEIRIRNGRVEYRTLSGRGARDIRTELARGGAARDAGELRIEEWTARGRVTIVQQPAPRNGFTTVIHIHDPQSGYGYYDFTLTRRSTYAGR
jgi:hypothetical protein